MRKSFFKKAVLSMVALLSLVSCNSLKNPEVKQEDPEDVYKYVPTIIIDINNGEEFAYGIDYQIDVRINPSMIDYDVYYYETSLGEDSKGKIKPTQIGDYTVVVETKANGEYAPNKASKTFKIVKVNYLPE